MQSQASRYFLISLCWNWFLLLLDIERKLPQNAPFGKRVNHFCCLASYLVNIWAFLLLNIYSCDRMEFSPTVSRITLKAYSVRNGSLLFMFSPFTGCNSKVNDGHSSLLFFIFASRLYQACGLQEALTILEIDVINKINLQQSCCILFKCYSVLTLSLLS